jgi:ADP-heptose:LPS heptosyltransferase
MKRFFSILLRQLQSKKSDYRMLKNFVAQKQEIERYPLPESVSPKKILIIRLDDIGDYLLYRNTLHGLKASEKFKGCSFTLLANQAWKEIFNEFDSQSVDDVIWVNKKEYFQHKNYQETLWKQLRQEGFGMVVCASRTRLLMLDDLCAIATNAPVRVGAENTFPSEQINNLSDSCYNQLLPHQPMLHEFFFNQAFANWFLQTNQQLKRPSISFNFVPPDIQRPYLICCIGAAHKSKRWPVQNWIDFIKLVIDKHGFTIVLSGSSAEAQYASEIEKEVAVINLVGRTTQIALLNYIKYATASICQDSMAAHLSVACQTPAVIIANGNNSSRFTTYEEIGVAGVKTVYPQRFLANLRKRKNNHPWHYIPVTKDIGTIGHQEVFTALQQVFPK